MSVSAAGFGTLGEKFLNDTFSEFAQSITINELTTTDDDQGGYSESWGVFASVTAFVLPQQGIGAGGESSKFGRLTTEQSYTFHMRPITGITTKMKIVYGGEDYQIRSIKDIAEGDQWLIIKAEKGVAQ